MSDRHPKWVRVEPGTVIPAGQPYRAEYGPDARRCSAAEFMGEDEPWTVQRKPGVVLVDSSWKPPLVLPTTPTWGIAVSRRDTRIGRWYVEGTLLRDKCGGWINAADVLDFIPLTDEQVARIEAAR